MNDKKKTNQQSWKESENIYSQFSWEEGVQNERLNCSIYNNNWF